MDPKNVTSFIPRKPLTPGAPMLRRNARPINLFMLLSGIVFAIVFLLCLGLFLFDLYQSKDLISKKTSLATKASQFSAATINDLSALDHRIRAATTILKNHIAVSGALTLIQTMTDKNVRLTSFTYDANAGAPKILMDGYGRSFNAVAFQSDVIRGSTLFENPLMTNIHLDDKGNVLFTVDANIDPRVTAYSITHSSLQQ